MGAAAETVGSLEVALGHAVRLLAHSPALAEDSASVSVSNATQPLARARPIHSSNAASSRTQT